VKEQPPDWPVAERVPVTIVTGDEAWRDGETHQLQAVVPPSIAGLSIAIPSSILGKIVEAERALVALDADLDSIEPSVVETITFALLRSESLSSSRIEGIRVSHRKLAEALLDPAHARTLAREVVGNIEAMRTAVNLGAAVDPFTPADVLELHGILMANVPGLRGGAWRSRQNWIGTDDLPAGAAYVPPPPEMIPALIDDLCAFINTEHPSSVVRAAIAHAQFEAIHPFGDGNGRVGRCLISVALRKGGGTHAIPPVSGVLLSDTAGYFEALHEFQQRANPLPWIARFADATVAACNSARALSDSIGRLQASWRSRLGTPRPGTVMDRLIKRLPLVSLADADMVATELSIDPNVARRALNTLERVGIAKQVAGGKRNRVWRVDEVHRLLDDHSLGRTVADG
jgi:Fic family protein